MFECIIFLISWGSILIFSWLILRACNLSLSRPSIPSIVFTFYIGFNYLGIPLLFFYKVKHLYNIGVQDRDVIWFFWLMSSICLLLLLLGFLYAKEIFKLNVKSYETFSYEKHSVEKFEIIIILFLCLVIFIRYYTIANVIPLVELLKGGDIDPSQLRSDVSFFPGKMWRYRLFFRDVLPFISYCLLALLLVQKSRTTFILFVFTLLFTSFVSLMNFHKAPIIYFLIGLILVYLIKNQKKITLRNVLIPSVIVVAVMMSTYLLFTDKKIEPRLLLSPFKRVLSGQIGSAYFYLKMFPKDYDFLYGRGMLPNPGGILPFESFPITKRIQDYKKQDLRERGIHGSSPAVYWASAYADFGIPGAFFASFVLGVIIFAVHWFVSRGKLTPLKTALIVWLAIHLSKISVTSLGKFMLDVNLLAILICSAFITYGPSLRRVTLKGHSVFIAK